MMTQQTDLLARYQHLRQATFQIANTLLKHLSKEAIHETARRLGILHDDTILLDNEDEVAVVMDYALYDIRKRGMNALERRLAEDPPPAGSEQLVMLEGMREAHFSLFMIESIQPGVGVTLTDLLYGGTVSIVDINFSHTAQVGIVMASRIVTIDGISMSTGATLPIGVIADAQRDEFMRGFVAPFRVIADAADTPEKRSKFSAMIIKTCLERGASTRIRRADPGEEPEPQETPTAIHSRWQSKESATKARAKLNKRCPCGSGRKFKNCCGAGVK